MLLDTCDYLLTYLLPTERGEELPPTSVSHPLVHCHSVLRRLRSGGDRKEVARAWLGVGLGSAAFTLLWPSPLTPTLFLTSTPRKCPN